MLAINVENRKNLIEVIVYRSSRTKKMRINGSPMIEVNNDEIFEAIRENDADIICTDMPSGLNTTNRQLFSMITTRQKRMGNNGVELNKVIRAGGFTEYIGKIEANHE